MKKIKVIGIYLLIFLLIGSLFFTAYWFSTKPVYSGSLDLAGLEQEVAIHYDQHGVPHLEAQTKEDLFRAFGYIHAQDRLFQMEMIKRLIHGRLSEIVGPKTIETDKYMRTLGLGRAAQRTAEKYMSSQSEEYQQMAQAYLAGINEYVENGKTPIEYTLMGIDKEQFTTTDLYNVSSFMALGFCAGLQGEPMMSELKNTLGEDYMKAWGEQFISQQSPKKTDTTSTPLLALADVHAEFEEILGSLGIPIWEGSNAWVISGDRTASGFPILANDTHIKFSQPAVYYEAHLKCPGIEVYGSFLAGMPFPVIGHTQSFGWGVTIFPVDNLDLYYEKKNPENDSQVWINNAWSAIESHQETIQVKGEEEITFEVQHTQHGPVVNDLIQADAAPPISLRWVALEEESQILRGTYNIIGAKNMKEFKVNMPYIDILGLNILYADTSGNIGWWATGKTPLRNQGVNPNYVLDGSESINEWIGYLSQDDLPQEENPKRGYIISSNNNPYEGSHVLPGNYHPEDRAKRIEKLLLKQKDWEAAAMQEVQLDSRGEQHLETNTILLGYLKNLDDQYLDILQAWQGEFSQEEIAPTLYTHLLHNTLKLMMEDELGEEEYQRLTQVYNYEFRATEIPKDASSIWWDDVTTTEKQESAEEITRQAWQKTIAYLEKSLGKDLENWKWKHTLQLTHVHPVGQMKPFDLLFNVGPYQVDGGNQTVNKMAFKNYGDSIYQVVSGPAVRTIIDLGDIEAARSIIPTGQSGVVSSKYYQDQADLFHQEKYRDQLMNWETIRNSSSKLILKP